MDSSKVDVTTYLDQSEVDKQTVSKAEELKQNNYVTFTGKGDLTVTIPLTVRLLKT
ncbi:phage tail sheath N-terminal beta-sandwich domain-containing protein [Bacillus subtilis]|uniref:phage tail sheath N-terminal beta-sandwich domain-containing protein n=1 Tax=Bacillus subtilis TaxID=1423 RepID=UPI003312FEED